ncbi:MAG: NTP transferase domain-containing protein, partial [Negativicutes bacterium]|nr:NTP transferase domain-containing protein [Negativicutes bacterium]
MFSAVILAAGASRRMGTPKQLLPVGGRPMVRRVAEAVCRSQVAEVIAVTGAYAEEVGKALKGLPVKIAFNPAWAEGQSGSVATGVKALSGEA